MMKKLTALLTALFLLLSATALADEVIHIGIIQFAEHGSLDNCRIGFIEGLAEEGFVEGENVVFDVQNAQADTAISAQIADVMAGKYDMICAIATPAAMAAFNAAEDAGIPVIYTAVSDPVSAMLAGADGKNPGNITGTSDALPVEAQLMLIFVSTEAHPRVDARCNENRHPAHDERNQQRRDPRPLQGTCPELRL